MRTKAERRHKDFSKALRKKKISEEHYGIEYYDNLHQYSKNKIHCSCPLCTSESNFGFRKKYTHADKVKADSMQCKADEYDN